MGRPGDRSRRDDDRYLMLEALLAARDKLYVSWVGRNVRDNSEQPASVLVSQLRDYLERRLGPRPGSSAPPSTRCSRSQPPLFRSRGGLLFTYAGEWRGAHEVPGEADARDAVWPDGTPAAIDTAVPITLSALTSFLKNPVKDFFRRQLAVVFAEGEEVMEDHETFALDGLTHYGLLDESLDALDDADAPDGAVPLEQRIDAQLARIRRSGRLPMAELGERAERELASALRPMLARWRSLHHDYPIAGVKEPLRFEHEGLVLDDWLDGLRLASMESGAPVWLSLQASRLATDKGAPRVDKLIGAWIHALVGSACGVPVQGVLVGRDATLTVQAMPADRAMATLRDLLDAWREGMGQPLPVAPLTALALLDGGKPEAAYEGGMFLDGEGREACLARVFPDFETLAADGRFEELAEVLYGPLRDWATTHVAVELHVEGDAT
jgi:exodeoxyribonuclease V gamma subunit